MKYLAIFLIWFSFLNASANEVKVKINPPRPVAGEVFQAYFRVFTSLDEEAVVNFSPGSLEVVSKSNQGISTRTVYANGKLTVSREQTIVYDLVAAKTGTAFLRDISVQLGNTRIRHPTIPVTILKEAEVLADVFLMVDVAKKTLYLGEGVVARYYLYSKVPVSNLDVKRYPKLNNFLKRFLQEPERTERVSVDGQVYMRTQIYAAKLYPEKIGELKIDSLHLTATYPSSRGNDAFGAFGLNRDFKTKSMNSDAVKIEVRPLPAPVPSHFTGLIGPHEFELQFGQTKLIVNEPLEIKLTVSGVGALENLEAPDIINNFSLEEFETNGDLKILSAESATKVFDYTFLAKENLKLPPKEIILSYFDPNSGRYVPTQLNVPEIIVAGGELNGSKNNDLSGANKKDEARPLIPPVASKDLMGPLSIEDLQWKRWLPVINFSFAAFAVLISLVWIVKEKKLSSFHFSSSIPKIFKKEQFALGEFIKWMTPLVKVTGKSPVTIIKDSPMSDESKKYFIELLSANDNKEYSSRKPQMEYKYRSIHFKELSRYIGSVSDESLS